MARAGGKTTASAIIAFPTQDNRLAGQTGVVMTDAVSILLRARGLEQEDQKGVGILADVPDEAAPLVHGFIDALDGAAAGFAFEYLDRRLLRVRERLGEDLTADGTSCVPTSAKVATAVGFVTLGIAFLVAGNVLADAKEHADCMAKRGWTVNWEQ